MCVCVCVCVCVRVCVRVFLPDLIVLYEEQRCSPSGTAYTIQKYFVQYSPLYIHIGRSAYTHMS